MAEWNAYYQNNEEEEEQEEGEQFRGKLVYFFYFALIFDISVISLVLHFLIKVVVFNNLN